MGVSSADGGRMFLILLSPLLVSAHPPITVLAPAPAAVQKPKVEKKICRKQDIATGSHMAKTLCLTQTDWSIRNQGLSAEEYGAMHNTIGH